MSRELDELDREFADLEEGSAESRMARRGGARLLPIAVAVIALAVFGGIVWYAYNQGVRSGSEEAAPLLAPEGEAKVAPEDPGGLEVEHTDKQVYDRISGDEADGESVERILPPPEDPMNPPEGESGAAPEVQSPEIPSITESEEEGAGEEPPLPDEKLAEPGQDPPTADLAGDQESAAATESADGAAASAESAADETAAESGAAEEASDSATASQQEDSAADASEETAAASADREASDAAGSDEAGASSAETQTASADPTSGWQIQIAALGSEAAARRAWAERQEALPDLLGDLTLAIQRAVVNDKTYYRVRGGPLASRDEATALCNALKAEDQACLVVAPEG